MYLILYGLKRSMNGILAFARLSLKWKKQLKMCLHTHIHTYKTTRCVTVQSNIASGAKSKRLAQAIKSSAVQRK